MEETATGRRPVRPGVAAAFVAEAPRLAASRRRSPRVVAIEHVGSTSVRGLAAKPAVDFAFGVARARRAHPYQAAGCRRPLRRDPRPAAARAFRRGAVVPWEMLVHVVEHDGRVWRDLLRSRDRLRSHAADACHSEELKRALLVDRGGRYRGADKRACIEPIVADGAPRPALVENDCLPPRAAGSSP